MERAAALSGPALTIHVADLPEEIRAGAPAGLMVESLPVQPAQFAQSAQPMMLSEQAIPVEGVSLDAVVTNIERELLLRSLNQTGGNKMQAAKLLRMKRTTFVEKLKRLNIEEFGETMIASLAPIGTGSSFFSGFTAAALSAAN
jgi:DNA-binding NtrC family response regulator